MSAASIEEHEAARLDAGLYPIGKRTQMNEDEDKRMGRYRREAFGGQKRAQPSLAPLSGASPWYQAIMDTGDKGEVAMAPPSDETSTQSEAVLKEASAVSDLQPRRKPRLDSKRPSRGGGVRCKIPTSNDYWQDLQPLGSHHSVQVSTTDAMPAQEPPPRDSIVARADKAIVLAKAAKARADAYIKRVRRRKIIWSCMRHGGRHRIKHQQMAREKSSPRLVSIGYLSKISSSGRTVPGTGRHAKYQYRLGDFSSKWNGAIAALTRRLESVEDSLETFTDSPTYSKDAESWYNCIMKDSDPPWNWQGLRDEVWHELQEKRRRELRERAFPGSQERPLDTLEETFWKKALHLTKERTSPTRQTMEIWQDAMLFVLHEAPTETPRFLQRTHIRPMPPSFMVAEAFEYSIAWANRHPATSVDWWRLVASAIKSTSATERELPLPIHGSYLTTVLQRLPVEEVYDCVAEWHASNVSVPGNTILHATQLLAKNGHTDQAVRLLDENMDFAVFHSSGRALQKVLATVLRKTARMKGGLNLCQELVTRLVQRGAVLNVQLCNIMMLNAIEANDPDTAFEIYKMLKNNNQSPDKYTFSILAKGCKMAGADEQRIAQVIDDALRSGVLLKEPVVATEVLQALFLHHLAKRRDECFRLVVEAYEQLFNRSPLEKLGLVSLTSASQSSKTLQPTAPVIGIIVDAYLKGASPSAKEALHLYRQILDLAKQGVPPFAELFRSEHVSNTFMSFFGSLSYSTLPIAMEVLRIMRSVSHGRQSSTLTMAADPEQDDAPNAAFVDYGNDFTLESDFEGLSSTSIGILHNIFAKQSQPSNKLIETARRMLDFMLASAYEIEPANLMEMLHAYLRHSNGDGAEWCVDRLVEMDAWNEGKGAGLRRAISDARARRTRGRLDH